MEIYRFIAIILGAFAADLYYSKKRYAGLLSTFYRPHHWLIERPVE